MSGSSFGSQKAARARSNACSTRASTVVAPEVTMQPPRPTAGSARTTRLSRLVAARAAGRLGHHGFVGRVDAHDRRTGREVGEKGLGHFDCPVGPGAQLVTHDRGGELESRRYYLFGHGCFARAVLGHVLFCRGAKLPEQSARPALGLPSKRSFAWPGLQLALPGLAWLPRRSRPDIRACSRGRSVPEGCSALAATRPCRSSSATSLSAPSK